MIEKIGIPSCYREFHCVAQDCSDSCCAGWQVDVDADSWEYYKTVEGEFGERLHSVMVEIPGEEGQFRLQKDGRCPFLNDSQLCDLFSCLGEKRLCKTCTNYPRFMEDYGTLREVGIAFSCPEAARLMLASKAPMQFDEIALTGERAQWDEAARDVMWRTAGMGADNAVDADYFQMLYAARQTAFAIVQQRALSIEERVLLYLDFGVALQAVVDDWMAVDAEMEPSEWDALKARAQQLYAQYRQTAWQQERVRQLYAQTKEWDENADGRQLYGSAVPLGELRYRLVPEYAAVLYGELAHCKPQWEVLLNQAQERLHGELRPDAYRRSYASFAADHADREYEYEHLLSYFVFKYFLKSYFDDDVYGKTQMAAVAYIMLRELGVSQYLLQNQKFTTADQAELFHLYSRELEHSDENFDAFMESLKLENMCNYAHLQGILTESLACENTGGNGVQPSAGRRDCAAQVERETGIDRAAHIDQLARQVLEIARDSIVVHLRFLDMALAALKLVPREGLNGMASDGQNLYYDAQWVLKNYEMEPARLARTYLHVLLHLIFFHSFQYDKLEAQVWDLAVDIAVESTIVSLGLPAVSLDTDVAQQERLTVLRRQISGSLTAENIYRYFRINPLSESGRQEWSKLFFKDFHTFWKPKREITVELERWQKISERVKTELRSFSRQKSGSEELLGNLDEATREHCDYGALLQRFTVLGEELQVNEDEFDYIYYTYGLARYGNMPLVEPLEYKEAKRIREFVIALDTSASCKGEIVQGFLRKTYQIIKNSESFFHKVNLHIVQCDSRIQQDVKITEQREFDAFLQEIRLRGFGGTDFRPVFRYVEQLCAKGEFTNLKGLIYFTDGYGTYPERMPDYPVLFAFLKEDEHAPKLPVWAMKAVLDEEELQTERSGT